MSFCYFLHYDGEYNLNIYSVDIYGQLHLEPSTAASSFLQKFDLGDGKNGTSRDSIKFLLFHLHYIRLNTD